MAQRNRRWYSLTARVGQDHYRNDPDRAAAALLAGIQGGVGIMLATGDLSYLEAALDEGIAALRGM